MLWEGFVFLEEIVNLKITMGQWPNKSRMLSRTWSGTLQRTWSSEQREVVGLVSVYWGDKNR